MAAAGLGSTLAGSAPAVASEPTSKVGFSFSPKAALYDGEDPEQALAALLSDLRPDLVRLPVFWDSVAPSADELDFTSVDRLLAVVGAYDLVHPRRPAKVVLVVGARNLGYPELHLPGWALLPGSTVGDVLGSAEYRTYLRATALRYATEPDLFAWQVENEPLDEVADAAAGQDVVPASRVHDDVALLHELDSRHPVVVSSYDSTTLSLDREETSPLVGLYSLLPGPRPVGHMEQAVQLGDVAGLDAYVVTASTSLRQAGVTARIAWKQQNLGFWAATAKASGKGFWVTEMQAGPWPDQPGFTPDDVVASASAYVDQGPQVILAWGVEDWLNSPRWLDAGERAFQLMRARTWAS